MVALTDYTVEMVPIVSVFPSPENDDIYGEITIDTEMEALISSIRSRGLEEPLIVASDDYVISGHRRHFACDYLGMDEIPVRRKKYARRDNLEQWPKILAEFNPQRIKTAGMLLREALLRHADDDPRALLREHELASVKVDANFTEVTGFKSVLTVSEKKAEFLAAVQKIVEDMREFWPLTVRQIHYQLLNIPPLISKPKRSKFDLERYRYRNDKSSYKALVKLLIQARYGRDVPMDCIDDPTRPKFPNRGFRNLGEFISAEMQGFLCGYHRDRQLDQPRHIEMLGEKSTLVGIIGPICRQYYVPLTLARGYASIPVWRDIAARFHASGKSAMTLIIASDWDPEGLDLAKDAIRSLRDQWSVPVEYHRVGVTREQIDELGIADDFNPAKVESSRFDAFVGETGDKRTWEMEALPPRYLQDQVRAAIEANMDMPLYQSCIDNEQTEADELARIRAEIVSDLSF